MLLDSRWSRRVTAPPRRDGGHIGTMTCRRIALPVASSYLQRSDAQRSHRALSPRETSNGRRS
jgi:hypothetical protein